MEKGKRLSLFIDGGFFHHLWDDLHDQGKTLSLVAFKAELEQLLSGRFVEAHYVRGRRGGDDPIDPVLVNAGIVRYDTVVRNDREIGADVKLALLAYESAVQGRIDVAVWFTGDGDLFPAMESLEGLGVHNVVLDVHLGTSALLLERAQAVSWADLVLHSCSMSERVPVVVDHHADPVDGGPRRGLITFIHETQGFALIEDTHGNRWYVSPVPMPNERREVEVRVGVRVRFSGMLKNLPGTNYPRAYSLRPDPDE